MFQLLDSSNCDKNSVRYLPRAKMSYELRSVSDSKMKSGIGILLVSEIGIDTNSELVLNKFIK